MKTLLVMMLLAMPLVGAEAPKPAAPTPPQAAPAPQLPRFDHVMDEDGKILATIDRKDDSVEYHAKEDLVVKVLIKRYMALNGECNRVVGELQAKLSPVKKSKEVKAPKAP